MTSLLHHHESSFTITIKGREGKGWDFEFFGVDNGRLIMSIVSFISAQHARILANISLEGLLATKGTKKIHVVFLMA